MRNIDLSNPANVTDEQKAKLIEYPPYVCEVLNINLKKMSEKEYLKFCSDFIKTNSFTLNKTMALTETQIKSYQKYKNKSENYSEDSTALELGFMVEKAAVSDYIDSIFGTRCGEYNYYTTADDYEKAYLLIREFIMNYLAFSKYDLIEKTAADYQLAIDMTHLCGLYAELTATLEDYEDSEGKDKTIYKSRSDFSFYGTQLQPGNLRAYLSDGDIICVEFKNGTVFTNVLFDHAGFFSQSQYVKYGLGDNYNKCVITSQPSLAASNASGCGDRYPPSVWGKSCYDQLNVYMMAKHIRVLRAKNAGMIQPAVNTGRNIVDNSPIDYHVTSTNCAWTVFECYAHNYGAGINLNTASSASVWNGVVDPDDVANSYITFTHYAATTNIAFEWQR